MDCHWSARIDPTFGKAKEKINSNTRKCANFYDLAKPYQLFKTLQTPPRPRLDEVDFYQGQRLPESFRASDWSDPSPRSLVQLESLLGCFKRGHVAFVGPAGSGKTTLVRSIAQDVLEGKFGSLGDIELVCFVQCANFRPDKLVSAIELLFYSDEEPLTPEERELIVQFVIKYPDRVLFVLDSLDGLQFTLDGVYETTEPHDLACPEAILSNFLAGKLFPGCRIITSSREHAIRNFKGEVRPDKVVALVGLTIESIRAILEGYVGKEEAEKILDHLQMKAPAQLSLCTTPVLLVYTLIGLKSERKFDPTTMTGIFGIVLQNLLRSPHTRQANILIILRKLEKLAWKATVEGRILFSADEFAEIGVNPVEATDIAILAPGGFSQKILRGSNLIFFSHLSLQEMLTSLHIVQIDSKSFDQTLDGDLHTPRFFVVRKFLCGILFDHDVHMQVKDLIEGTSDIEEKRSKLKKSLLDQLGKTDRGPDFLQLLLSLHEAKNGAHAFIRENLNKVDVEDLPLSISDIYAVGSVIARCKHLSELDLQNCNLDANSVALLASLFDESDVKISQFWLGRNTNLGDEGMKSVGKMSAACSANKLHFFKCNLQPSQLLVLKSALGNTQISLLDVSGNPGLGVDGVVSSRQIAENCSVEHFDVQKCRLTADQLDALVKFAPESRVKIMRLNENVSATHRNIVAITKVLRHVTETLSLGGWKVSPDDLTFLQQELNKHGNERLVVRFKDISMKSTQQAVLSSCSASSTALEDSQSPSKKLKTGDEESDETIGTEGGTMKVGTCRAIFSPGALPVPTLIQVLITDTPEDCPEEYFAITSMMTCEPSMKFNAPVTLKLPPFCSTESDDVIVHVMAKETNGNQYKPVDKMKLKDCCKYVTFQVTHFTLFWALVERIFLGKVQYKIVTSIYFDAEGNFTVVLHSGNRSAIDQRMEKFGFLKAHVFFDERSIYLDESLFFSLTYRDLNESSFSPKGFNDFCLGQNFENSRQKHLQFVLDAIPEPNTLLKLKATLQQKDESCPIDFNIKWPRFSDLVPKPSNQDTTQVTRDVIIINDHRVVNNNITDNSVQTGDVVAHTFAFGEATVQSDERGATIFTGTDHEHEDVLHTH